MVPNTEKASVPEGPGFRSKLARIAGRGGLLVAVTAFVAAVFARVILPWNQNWGATPEEVRASLPGDELSPDATYVSTRAVTIAAAPEAIWPWLVQIGQGRGGLYSYERLENLVGCRIQNADRIHPEWQDVKIGDPVRLVPDGFLGMKTVPMPKIAAIEPRRALVVDGLGSFVLVPLDSGTTRLLVRGRAESPFISGEPFNFLMYRRMLLGIQERAEGRLVPPVFDDFEALLWTVAFIASVIAGLRVLMQRDWWIPLPVLLGSIAVFLVLVFASPSLSIGLLLDLALIVVLVMTRAKRPRSAARVEP